jgi:hypothetical protein
VKDSYTSFDGIEQSSLKVPAFGTIEIISDREVSSDTISRIKW